MVIVFSSIQRLACFAATVLLYERVANDHSLSLVGDGNVTRVVVVGGAFGWAKSGALARPKVVSRHCAQNDVVIAGTKHET